MEDYKKDEYQEFANALGRVALAWNDLNARLGNLFATVIGIPNGLVGLTVWNAINSDRTAREVLKDTAKIRFTNPLLVPNPKALMLIHWLANQVCGMEDLRNNFLHSPFHLTGSKSAPIVESSHQLGNKRASKLKGKNLLKEAEFFYLMAITLRDFCVELEKNIYRRDRALPRKPKMPERGHSLPS